MVITFKSLNSYKSSVFSLSNIQMDEFALMDFFTTLFRPLNNQETYYSRSQYIHSNFDGIASKVVGNPNRDKIFVVFEKIIKLVNEFRREFGIEVLTRCGIRFFYLSKFNSDDENIISKFNILFNNNLVDTVENKLGSISDVGIIFEGQNKDLTKYRVHFGPYSKKESDRYFPTISNYLKTVDGFNFIADIDLYEANFTLHSSVSFMKWCNPLIKKAHDYVSDIKSIII